MGVGITIPKSPRSVRKVPWLLVSVLVAGPILVLGIAEAVGGPDCTPSAPCRDALGTSAYWVDAPTAFTAITLVPLAFLFPRVAVWAAVAVGLAGGLPGGAQTNYPVWWLVLAGLWCGLGLWDRAARLRRRQSQPIRRWVAGVLTGSLIRVHRYIGWSTTHG